ncbi:Signal peptidase subunit family protein [Theileria parva strain Muguga]|uniref:Signal peptidase complex subunit 3 n=1 Tax=Theileria parva TaxID=5875 RepID=Q4N379_THEPA|nr:Signal peptidase subunit family protein [Theileria parva strain Muguga]EAN31460.1 Signal peptidase subunit family protein [Theileria parva strain Muguga]|eukprot:XP_763743.1 signal peptidase [Theileria parva strain Muguga]
MIALMALALNYYTGVNLRTHKHVTGDVKHVKTHELTLDKYKVDRALLELSMGYDLRGVFDWSTHVVFLYVTANYVTNRHERSEVVIFDKIINKSEAYQPSTNVFAKYFLYDFGRSLRNRQVSLKFFYEIVPIGGFIKQFQLSHHTFTLPPQYSQS